MTEPLYTPILRWKPAEQWALAKLTADQKRRIKPLIELMPPRRRRSGFALRVAQSIVGAWGTRRDVFVDHARLVGVIQFGPHADAVTTLRESGAAPQIVLSLSRSPFDDELRRWLAHRVECSCAIRVRNSDLSSSSLQDDLRQLVESAKRRTENVDLLLDFGSMTDGTSMQRTAELVARSARWKSATIIGGSFPTDLTGLAKNNQHLLPRAEWLAWESIDRRAIGSRCGFGDYTVVAAEFTEPPPKANFSASIRYTAQRDFVVMRGEGVFNDEGQGFKQYPAQAEMLMLRREYCGAGFSAGDRYIADMSSERSRTGSAQTWLRAGINHHLVYVGHQLAA